MRPAVPRSVSGSTCHFRERAPGATGGGRDALHRWRDRAPGVPIDDGVQRLQLVTEALADLSPDEFSDAVVEAIVPDSEHADDVVILAGRHDGQPGGSAGIEAKGEPDHLAAAIDRVDAPSLGEGLHDEDAAPGGGQGAG